ncbi:MAG: hypothetical protein OHK0052_13150 [Anaerolineales bacterium]
MLIVVMAFLQETASETVLIPDSSIGSQISIAKIVQAVHQHLHYPYSRGTVGAARLPVLALYSAYNLLIPDVKRYAGKTLASLQAHTSPDSRSKSLGDIDINSPDGTCFESLEIKYNKTHHCRYDSYRLPQI